jgi:hypothetical protein
LASSATSSRRVEAKIAPKSESDEKPEQSKRPPRRRPWVRPAAACRAPKRRPISSIASVAMNDRRYGENEYREAHAGLPTKQPCPEMRGPKSSRSPGAKPFSDSRSSDRTRRSSISHAGRR